MAQWQSIGAWKSKVWGSILHGNQDLFCPTLVKEKNPSPRAIILEAVTDMKLNFTVNIMLSKRQFYVKEAEWKLD